MEIAFWNCQGLRPKRKTHEIYLRENNVDVITLNETFLKPHMHFSLPGYDIKRNDRTWSTKGGVVFLYKSELILNKVYDNNNFNIITNNETLAVELELSNKTTLTLTTIYCPGGKPDPDLFRRLPHFWIK